MTLAINGGKPVRSTPFPRWPFHDEQEVEALQRALAQGTWWRVGAEEVASFEREFGLAHGAEHALAVTTGTAALETALLALNIGPGDEVIVPAFTFIATAMSVQRVGATPVPVDIDLDTYCISPDQVSAALTSRTKAVIPVHMAGQICDMDRLESICSKSGAAIIQDAAHAHGSRWGGKRVGEFGSIACFSFQNFKLMTAGEGGALLFPSRELRDRAYLVQSCGRPLGDTAYQHLLVGSNYRMNEFSAAVLRCQLRRLESQNAIRQRNARSLFEQLRTIPGIIPQGSDARNTLQSYYMAMFRWDAEALPNLRARWVADALIAEGIPAYVNYLPVYRTRAFWERRTSEPNESDYIRRCPHTETVASTGVWLHHRVLLGTENDIADVVEAVRRVFGERSAL